MFDQILVALDGSEEARRAGILALRIASELGSNVVGLHVIDARVVEGPAVETLAPLWGEVTGRPFQPEVMRIYRERGSALLEEFCAAAGGPGCGCVERYLEIGVAEEVILARAAEANLLAMGRRGEHAGFGRQVVGSTVGRVLHHAPIPVLIGGTGAEVPRRPLVAYDAGESAGRALNLAIEYALGVGGELRLVHAGEESADRVLDAAHRHLEESAVPWESVRLDAEPGDAVAEALERWEADCLFMGAFGRGRLRDFLFGSHTTEILEKVGVPVFAVH